MKARLLDPMAPLYEQPNLKSPPITLLVAGQEFEITGITTIDGLHWAAAVLSDERRGYLPSGTNMYRYHSVTLPKETNVYAQPSVASPVVARYGSGATLLAVGAALVEERSWTKVRDGDGIEGLSFRILTGRTRPGPPSPEP